MKLFLVGGLLDFEEDIIEILVVKKEEVKTLPAPPVATAMHPEL